ncbi:hypothetical protein L596_019919 [Steinernema carpocapsae]|uniref:Uncharacterized protein n=1 Tax=Steinernema carpocapsae TaxID=34508 RepID=A0A4U5MSL3_STECR|nr:hypothetical protein L596_019919 [Steinernema carpocapsae]
METVSFLFVNAVAHLLSSKPLEGLQSPKSSTWASVNEKHDAKRENTTVRLDTDSEILATFESSRFRRDLSFVDFFKNRAPFQHVTSVHKSGSVERAEEVVPLEAALKGNHLRTLIQAYQPVLEHLTIMGNFSGSSNPSV